MHHKCTELYSLCRNEVMLFVTIEKKLKSTVSVRQHLDANVILSIPEEGSIRLFGMLKRGNFIPLRVSAWDPFLNLLNPAQLK